MFKRIAPCLLLILALAVTTVMAESVGPPRRATQEAKKIRVGLIRADSHGMYFSALMDELDARLLNAPPTELKNPPCSWMTGSYHPYFFETSDIAKMTAPFVGGFDIVKVWDEHPEAARTFELVMNGGPAVCETCEEVSDGLDLVLIADCNYGGSDHLKPATPGLKKGVPTFVDKPLAYDLKDARAIIEPARIGNRVRGRRVRLN